MPDFRHRLLFCKIKQHIMTTASLTFTKSNDVWVTTFVSVGNCIVEIERAKRGTCSVSANIEGMQAVPVASFHNPYMANVIFRLNIPVGIEVTIKSATEVSAAKMLSE